MTRLSLSELGKTEPPHVRPREAATGNVHSGLAQAEENGKRN